MKYSIGIFGGIAATSIIYFMLIKGLKDSSFMTPGKQALDTGEHCYAHRLLLRVLHHIDAGAALVQGKRIQDSGASGYFRPRPRLCRQRLGELHRCAPCRLLLFHRLYDQRHCCRSRRLPDDLTARPCQNTVVLPYRCGRHHGICAVHIQESTQCNQDFRRPLPPGRR